MQFKKLIEKKFVIIFSHSNYTKNFVSGTEKVIFDMQNLYNESNISVIHFFPLSKFKKYVGMNINGKFCGIYNIKKIVNLFYLLKKENKKCESLIIHHLKGFDLNLLGDVLKKINSDLIVAIHDFYLVCNSFNFLKNKKEYCGVTKISKEKCENCYNYNSAIKFEKEREAFLKKVSDQITKIIFPSEFCKEKWLEIFPEFKNKSIVREHLVYKIKENKMKNDNKNNKIKIAYIGRKNLFKGINNWNTIINNEKLKEKYDFFYFGIDIEECENVKEIYINNANNERSMEKVLKENNIDIVVLWSIIPETFSFTYFEASSAGCLIITNYESGNINRMVKKVKNGWVLKTTDEVIDFLYKLERKDLYFFNTIEDVNSNNSLKEFKINENIVICKKNKKFHPNIILTLLFFIIKLKGKR